MGGRTLAAQAVRSNVPAHAGAQTEKGAEGMNILVIDGQGGMIGRQLITELRGTMPDAEITAVGTNTLATASMLKAGADNGATGENAVLVCTRGADVIVGPIGIVIADSLLGEVTPKMAAAVGASPVRKILLPVNKCNNIIVGTSDKSTSELIAEAVRRVKAEI